MSELRGISRDGREMPAGVKLIWNAAVLSIFLLAIVMAGFNVPELYHRYGFSFEFVMELVGTCISAFCVLAIYAMLAFMFIGVPICFLCKGEFGNFVAVVTILAVLIWAIVSSAGTGNGRGRAVRSAEHDRAKALELRIREDLEAIRN